MSKKVDIAMLNLKIAMKEDHIEKMWAGIHALLASPRRLEATDYTNNQQVELEELIRARDDLENETGGQDESEK